MEPIAVMDSCLKKRKCDVWHVDSFGLQGDDDENDWALRAYLCWHATDMF